MLQYTKNLSVCRISMMVMTGLHVDADLFIFVPNVPACLLEVFIIFPSFFSGFLVWGFSWVCLLLLVEHQHHRHHIEWPADHLKP